MKFVLLMICVIPFSAPSESASAYQYRVGHCEPFTYEFLAGLIQREARHILTPLRRRPESLHTDVTFFGYHNPLGQAAFYANWGLGQPHCPNATAMEPDFTCDHFAAIYYFAETLRHPKSFGAVRCKSMREINGHRCAGCRGAERCAAQVFMGGEPAVPKKGLFYMSSRSVAPYGYSEMVKMQKPTKPTIQKV